MRPSGRLRSPANTDGAQNRSAHALLNRLLGKPLCCDGMTKIGVAGLRLTFPEAEKLALGKITLEELRRAPAGR